MQLANARVKLCNKILDVFSKDRVEIEEYFNISENYFSALKRAGGHKIFMAIKLVSPAIRVEHIQYLKKTRLSTTFKASKVKNVSTWKEKLTTS